MWIVDLHCHDYHTTIGKVVKVEDLKEAEVKFEVKLKRGGEDYYRWYLVSGDRVEVFDCEDVIIGVGDTKESARMAVLQHYAGTIANTSIRNW